MCFIFLFRLCFLLGVSHCLSRGDQADEIYFVFEGSVLIFLDLSDIVDMRHLVKSDGAFNVPIIVFSAGSIFGDADLMVGNNNYRSVTATS